MAALSSSRDSAVCIAVTNCSGGDPATLWVSPAQLASGGFSDYSLTADQGGLTVADDTTVTLQQRNLVLPANYDRLTNQSSLIGKATMAVLPDQLRQPVSLSLNQVVETATAQVNGANYFQCHEYDALPDHRRGRANTGGSARKPLSIVRHPHHRGRHAQRSRRDDLSLACSRVSRKRPTTIPRRSGSAARRCSMRPACRRSFPTAWGSRPERSCPEGPSACRPLAASSSSCRAR